MDDVAALQQVNPGTGGDMRHAGVVAQTGQIEQLPGAPGTKPYKSLKALQVLHCSELTQIALHISGEVVGQRL